MRGIDSDVFCRTLKVIFSRADLLTKMVQSFN